MHHLYIGINELTDKFTLIKEVKFPITQNRATCKFML